MAVQSGRVAAGRLDDSSTDALATQRGVEGLCPLVLLEDPQIQPRLRTALDRGLGAQDQEPGPNARTLMGVSNMQVVEESAPIAFTVENRVSKPDETMGALGHKCATRRVRVPEPAAPHADAIGADIAIQEGV